MADAKPEETPEPFWLGLFWLLFRRAVLAMVFLAIGYYCGYYAGWEDFRLELKALLQQESQSAPTNGYEETL